jgi:hypothetical protein
MVVVVERKRGNEPFVVVGEDVNNYVGAVCERDPPSTQSTPSTYEYTIHDTIPFRLRDNTNNHQH